MINTVCASMVGAPILYLQVVPNTYSFRLDFALVGLLFVFDLVF